MHLSNIESQNKSNIEKSASPISRPKKTPVIPVHHTLVADIVSMGEHVAHERRAAYRMLEIKHPDVEETEMVILPAAKAGDDTLLRAVPALYDAGVRRLTLYLASAESWKHRRVEGVGLHMPVEPVASVAFPLQQAPKAETPAAPHAPPAKPAIAPVFLEGERLQGKRYNTSDGFDRQVIRLPGKGPLSTLFQGSGCQCRLNFPQKCRSKIPQIGRSGCRGEVAIFRRTAAGSRRLAWHGRGDGGFRSKVFGHQRGVLA